MSSSNNRPKWSISRAATECAVSRSTIRRYREAGKFPNAEKTSHGWVIPLTDLLAAGLKPGTSRPEPEQPNEQAQDTMSGLNEHAQRLSDLEHELALEQLKRQAAEQLANERERQLVDLRQALRMLEATPKPTSEPTQDDPAHEQSNEQGHVQMNQASEQATPAEPSRSRGFWGRLFGR